MEIQRDQLEDLSLSDNEGDNVVLDFRAYVADQEVVELQQSVLQQVVVREDYFEHQLGADVGVLETQVFIDDEVSQLILLGDGQNERVEGLEVLGDLHAGTETLQSLLQQTHKSLVFKKFGECLLIALIVDLGEHGEYRE